MCRLSGYFTTSNTENGLNGLQVVVRDAICSFSTTFLHRSPLTPALAIAF